MTGKAAFGKATQTRNLTAGSEVRQPTDCGFGEGKDRRVRISRILRYLATAFESALTSAIAIAERILTKIDARWPAKQ